MNIRKSNKQNLVAFSFITGILLMWLVYANHTGWYLFNGDDHKQAWSSSGPGYHK